MRRLSIKAEAAEVGLCISTWKTKTMETEENGVNAGERVIDGEEYKGADDFIDLGSTICANGQRSEGKDW